MDVFTQFFRDFYSKFNPVPQPQPQSLWNKIIENRYVRLVVSQYDTNYWTLLITVIVICVSLWTFIRLWDWFKEIVFLIKGWTVPVLAMYGFTQLPYIMIFIRYMIDCIEQTPELLRVFFDNFR